MRTGNDGMTFPCDGCGRPIDPIRHAWFIDDDGCNLCEACFLDQLDDAAEADEAEWRGMQDDIMSDFPLDLVMRRLQDA